MTLLKNETQEEVLRLINSLGLASFTEKQHCHQHEHQFKRKLQLGFHFTLCILHPAFSTNAAYNIRGTKPTTIHHHDINRIYLYTSFSCLDRSFFHPAFVSAFPRSGYLSTIIAANASRQTTSHKQTPLHRLHQRPFVAGSACHNFLSKVSSTFAVQTLTLACFRWRPHLRLCSIDDCVCYTFLLHPVPNNKAPANTHPCMPPTMQQSPTTTH